MIQLDKELLHIELSKLLPYGVKVLYKGNVYDLKDMHYDGHICLGSYNSIYGNWFITMDDFCKEYPIPFLRSIPNMTDEEYIELRRFVPDLKSSFEQFKLGKICFEKNYANLDVLHRLFCWLRMNHFNICLPYPLFIEVTPNNNPYK